MIDFLLKHNLSYAEILNFISQILECKPVDISLISQDKFNETASPCEIKTKYLCIFFEVYGEASKMLQIYRSKLETEELTQRIVSAAQDLRISCFIPADDFAKWIYIDNKSRIKYMEQIDLEDENLYFFKEID